MAVYLDKLSPATQFVSIANGRCVTASYGSLTGEFAVTNGLPRFSRIEYAHDGNQIAVVMPAAGMLLLVR